MRAVIREVGNIELLTRPLNTEEIDELYQRADVVMSLHRSEGFGLVMAEAMLHGLPVIATDWSANRDFLNDSNWMPVRCSLVPVVEPQGEYNRSDLRWADPDVRCASAKLKVLHSDSRLTAELGQRAREDAVRVFNAEIYSDAVTGIVSDARIPQARTAQ